MDQPALHRKAVVIAHEIRAAIILNHSHPIAEKMQFNRILDEILTLRMA